jgi:hypothetical protein
MRWQIQKITALPDHVSVDVLLLPDVGDPMQLPAAGLPQNISLPPTAQTADVQTACNTLCVMTLQAQAKQVVVNATQTALAPLVGTTGTVTKFT